MDRTILHADCNSFFASVESVSRPELRTVPMAVCGDPENRHGIVLAKNDLAKRCGVQTAETVWQARRKCPELVIVPPHYDRYEEYYRRINALYCEYTDRVEPFSIDESWLDVTGSARLFGDGQTIADTLRRRVREELGITVSVGVSFNKTFAKLGSDYRKPDATTVFSRENYREMLYPLPITDFLFVGHATAAVMERMGIRTIGDLAAADPACLAAALGKPGVQLHDYANGRDTAEVARFDDRCAPKSVSNGMTFRRDLTTAEEVRAGLLCLCEPVVARLRAESLCCRTAQLTVKYPSLQTVTKQRSLAHPTALLSEFYAAVLQLLPECWQGAPLRSLTVGAMRLEESGTPRQLSLFEEDDADHRERQGKLEETVDGLRNRFGKTAVKRCAVLHGAPGENDKK